ncbi:helix-turn-helix domain-containing protein [Pedobacter sp. MC2016-14]|uniref:helix-turn-helix domain-containing protein n=1 Tax=Pedobacter sp. MC2016-14 TaxID=2897327 RepID=UPI001E46E437|nr:helix-turn-helix transcriptional regulator [Pedobacter sp. MC2016-14]MCD0487739.1 helix-turn-helix domain-containing protein [Pedobacter sp. MC2016-14]
MVFKLAVQNHSSKYKQTRCCDVVSFATFTGRIATLNFKNMSPVALKIKRLRSNIGLTQEQMAERIHLSVKAWQNIENGITKIDLDRLNQIAEILETSVIDFINSEEGMYVHQEIVNNDNIYNKEVTIHQNVSESERELFNKVIADKDKEIEFLRGLIQGKKDL